MAVTTRHMVGVWLATVWAIGECVMTRPAALTIAIPGDEPTHAAEWVYVGDLDAGKSGLRKGNTVPHAVAVTSAIFLIHQQDGARVQIAFDASSASMDRHDLPTDPMPWARLCVDSRSRSSTDHRLPIAERQRSECAGTGDTPPLQRRGIFSNEGRRLQTTTAPAPTVCFRLEAAVLDPDKSSYPDDAESPAEEPWPIYLVVTAAAR